VELINAKKLLELPAEAIQQHVSRAPFAVEATLTLLAEGPEVLQAVQRIQSLQLGMKISVQLASLEVDLPWKELYQLGVVAIMAPGGAPRLPRQVEPTPAAEPECHAPTAFWDALHGALLQPLKPLGKGLKPHSSRPQYVETSLSLNEMHSRANRSIRLIEKVRRYAHLCYSQHPLPLQEIQLSQLLPAVSEGWDTARIYDQRIKIVHTIAASDMERLRSLPLEGVVEALRCLIERALAVSDGKRVHLLVNYSAKTKLLVCECFDTGPQLSGDILEHLTEPFCTDATAMDSACLDLPIVCQLARLMPAELAIEQDGRTCNHIRLCLRL
jgi:hypothetical protein